MAAQIHVSVVAEADGECERQTLPSPSHAGTSDAWGVRQLRSRTPRRSLGDIAAAAVAGLAAPKPSKDQRAMTSTQTVTPSPSTRTTPVREKKKKQQEVSMCPSLNPFSGETTCQDCGVRTTRRPLTLRQRFSNAQRSLTGRVARLAGRSTNPSPPVVPRGSR